MKKLKRFLFVIIAIIPILCVSCDNDEQGEEVTKIVESRTSQDLMSGLCLDKMEYVMNNLWLYVALCAIFIIGILVIVIIRILNNHQNKENYTSSSKSKMSYREKKSKELKKKIDDKLKQHDSLLAKLKEELVNRYGDVPKTYTNLTRINNSKLHLDLSGYFGLSREENILYCRRYTRTFGSDSFFIITEKGFGYAPHRKPEDFLLFEDVSELIKNDDLNVIMFINNHDETVLYVDADDFTCDYTSDELIKEINRFLSQYQSPLDIYLDAGFEALDRKLTPILPDIIQHIGNYTEGWKLFLRAGYKYVLAEDGEDVKHNNREAFDDIKDIEKSLEDDKNGTIYCACELLRAKIMLLDEEADHMEIKKILDTVAGNAENPNIKDEANLIRRQLKL